MRIYRRIGVAAVIGVAMLSLAGCGQARSGGTGSEAADSGAGEGSGQVAVEVAADLTPEGQALAALGFQQADIAPAAEAVASESAAGTAASEAVSADPATSAAAPSPGANAGNGTSRDRARQALRERRVNRVLLRRNTLHGEVVVQAKDGPVTVLVQRGEVTAITGSTITVKSTDGYSQIWTFGDPIRVIDRRTTVQPSDVGVGTQVGVAGVRSGDASVARLVVIPFK